MNKKHINITVSEKNSDPACSLDELFDRLMEEISIENLSVERASAYASRCENALQKAVENEIGSSAKTGLLRIDPFSAGEINNGTKKMRAIDYFKKITCLLIAVALITLGFSMIILPAPPYFEMFTVFYFNDDDGVTIMDLISLIIILCGVYVFVTTIIKKTKYNSI